MQMVLKLDGLLNTECLVLFLVQGLKSELFRFLIPWEQ